MRSWSKWKKAGLLMTVACTIVSASATAQDYATFVVVRSLKDPKEYYVYIADSCKPNINFKASQQPMNCTLKKNECDPGKCKFDTNSTDLPPLALTFGISSYNPPCGWVFNWATGRYVYYPC